MKREHELCHWCDEPILPGDDLSPMILNGGAHHVHLECGFRMVAGGVNHLLKRCTCCGGSLDPDPRGLSKREAARAAFAVWQGLRACRNARPK